MLQSRPNINAKMSFSYELLDEKSLEDLDRWFCHKNCLYEYNPGRCVMPREFSYIAPRILNAEVRKDDVWLASYPRSGSTWCQEITWLIGNNFDFEKSRSVIQHLRTPIIEMSLYFAENRDYCRNFGDDSVEYVKNLPSPRFLKTHLPYQFLPKQLDEVKPKIIYVARNPKDVYCSYYPHLRMFHGLKGSFDAFAKYYITGKVPLGCPIDHQLSFWNRRTEPNVLFLRFEDAKADTRGTVRRIADFLEKPIAEEQLQKVCDYVSLEQMRDNPGVNMEKHIEFCSSIGNDYGGGQFIGHGRIGSWKTCMSENLSKEFDEWIDKKTRDTDLIY